MKMSANLPLVKMEEHASMKFLLTHVFAETNLKVFFIFLKDALRILILILVNRGMRRKTFENRTNEIIIIILCSIDSGDVDA